MTTQIPTAVASDLSGILPQSEAYSADRQKKYKLVEIYSSVKGEGTQAGIPMTFVRFSKCNLACSWCDTPYNRVAITMDRRELFYNILQHDPAWVVFTGGEPMMQLDSELTTMLKDRNIRMAIETNGVLWNDAAMDMDYVNISPKIGEPVSRDWLPRNHGGRMTNDLVDEIRFTLCDKQTDLWNVFNGEIIRPTTSQLETATSMETFVGLAANWYTVSPAMDDPAMLVKQPGWKSGDGFPSANGVVNQASFATCLAVVNRYRKHHVRLSTQVHKFIGVR